MDDLTALAFAAARLDEDEAAAKAVKNRNWAMAVIPGPELAADVREHIIRHDPARVLREVEAGRRILARHSPAGGMAGPCCTWCSDDTDSVSLNVPWPCPDVLDLLSRWAGHPDFRPEWKP